MPELIFHPDVSKEVQASFVWYQKQAEGLGNDFVNELETGFGAITEMSETWPKFQNGFRRFLLSKFPFSIIYKSKGESIFVVAVMHNSRKPGYWQNRT